ncbi:hypothetical protein ES703_119672 [subsurface metagenome]
MVLSVHLYNAPQEAEVLDHWVSLVLLPRSHGIVCVGQPNIRLLLMRGGIVPQVIFIPPFLQHRSAGDEIPRPAVPASLWTQIDNRVAPVLLPRSQGMGSGGHANPVGVALPLAQGHSVVVKIIGVLVLEDVAAFDNAAVPFIVFSRNQDGIGPGDLDERACGHFCQKFFVSHLA